LSAGGSYRRISEAEIVQGAQDPMAALLQDVSVDHCRRDIVVPEQCLDSADVRPSLEQVGGETVPVMLCST
jgi:hypothetical protein